METQNRYKDVNFCLRCGNPLHIATDREQKARPQCSKCGWIFYKNAVPAVTCIVLNPQNQLLLVLRKYEPQLGMWALPSGYMEIWQDPEETAIEELHEETGLIGTVDKFIGYYNGNSPIYEKVLSLGFTMNITGGTLCAGDDAIDARFFDINDLPELAFISNIVFLKNIGIIVDKGQQSV